MRILYITSYQGPEVIAQRAMRRNRAIGGSRKIEVISHLLHNQGHDVTILSSGIPAERSCRFYPAFESTTASEVGRGARVIYAAGLDIRLLNYASAVWSSILWLRREASQRTFDVLLIYNIDEFTWFIVMYYLRYCRRVPAVLEYEDSVNVIGRGTGGMRRRMWSAMERSIRPHLTGVLSVNTILADRMENANTYVLPGIVDRELCRLALARRPAFSGDPPFLALFCGGLFPGKGAQMIPQIAEQFKGRIRFVIAGTGPLLDDLSAESQICGGDVEVLGFIERHKLNVLLTSADILLNPHEEEQSGGVFPFKLLEYLVAGGVVITTRNGSLNDVLYDHCEVIRPDRLDLASAIEHVLTCRDEMAVRSRKAQAWAISMYSEDTVAQELDRVLAQAAKMGMPDTP